MKRKYKYSDRIFKIVELYMHFPQHENIEELVLLCTNILQKAHVIFWKHIKVSRNKEKILQTFVCQRCETDCYSID